MRQLFMIFGVLALLFVAACTTTPSTVTKPNETNTTGTQCADPRPEICTKEYMPVCGDNGQTYGNKCEACADKDVNSYTGGACAGSEKLFEVTYAGGFVAPSMSQTVFSVTGNTFTWQTLGQDNVVTSEKTRELSDAEAGELRDIIAGIGTLAPSYPSDLLVTDVGYADIQVAGQQTRVEKNIDEAWPAELLPLRQWIQAQTDQFPDYQGRTYKSRDPEMCARIRYTCDAGQKAFSDESGCGCEPEANGSGTHLALTECKPEQRGMMCTQQFDPVCAQVDTGIRCIKAPCPSTVYKTMGNACTACSDEKVYGYFPGECGDLEGKNPEDLASA